MIQMLCILADAFFLALLIWCAVMDLRTRTVSNVAVLLVLALGVGHAVLIGISGSAWWPYPAGLLLSAPFFTAWLKGGMGAGDVKLLMGIGLYLGLVNSLMAYILIFLALVVVTVFYQWKEKTIRNATPLAPVLALGAGGAVMLGWFL